MKKQHRKRNVLAAALLLCVTGTLALWAADDAKIKLTDAAGTSTFAVQNNVPATVMSVDSLGNINTNRKVTSGVVSSQTGGLTLNNAGSAFSTTFQAGIATANVTYTLPTADAAASGAALTSNGAGTLSWTSPLPIANGGTGQTTANAAFNALAPAQAGNAGKFLQTDATNTSWAKALPQNVQYATDTVTNTTITNAEALIWGVANPSITLASATDRIYVTGEVVLSGSAITGSANVTIRVRRGANCAAAQIGFDVQSYLSNSTTERGTVPFSFVDTPGAVGPYSYTVCALSSANRSITSPRIALTLMEIGP